MNALLLSLIAPVLGGLLSLSIWQSKRNSIRVEDGIRLLHNSVDEVSTKLNEMSIEVAKKYVTTDWMVRQMEAESKANDEISDRLDGLTYDLKKHIEDSNAMAERFRADIAEIKDMQWQMRLEQLDTKNHIE